LAWAPSSPHSCCNLLHGGRYSGSSRSLDSLSESCCSPCYANPKTRREAAVGAVPQGKGQDTVKC
jgi:hypothetical protein